MKKLTLIILTFLLTLSCEKVSFNDQYSFLYGDWTPTQLSAGMDYSADPHKIGDVIQIIKNDSYKVIKNDIVVGKGKIDIENQSADNLTIQFKAKELNPIDQLFYRMSISSLTVTIFSQDSIRLTNNATDGGYFGLLLVKKK
ncbi:MAG: hypothetical protein IPJ16_02150 [Bacteroidales bacterium]|nr:hypothetical protein [Bacteroidales bacterium]